MIQYTLIIHIKSGCKDWLRKYRPFECGIPVDDTIARVIKRIEPQAFNEVFLNFINEIRTQQGREV
ncbi:transposase family protein, partial [Glaesserella parasuis]